MKSQTCYSKSLIYWSMFYSYATSRKLKRRLSPQFPAVYIIELSLPLLLCCSKKYLNIDICVLIISLTGSFILIAQLSPPHPIPYPPPTSNIIKLCGCQDASKENILSVNLLDLFYVKLKRRGKGLKGEIIYENT